MAEYVLFSVLRTLGELSHIPELKGRTEVLQKLRQLQAILQVADARKEVDEGIRNWVAETREVAYDIEDQLLVALSPKTLRRSFTYRSREATIQAIDAKISALESDLRIRNIKPRQRGRLDPAQQVRRVYSSYLAEDDFVGMDEDVQDLITRIVKPDVDKMYQVISITGLGGIGKTTLAKRVYHHPHVRKRFHAFAWASVSQEWQPEDVLHKLLNKLEPEKKKEISLMRGDQLFEELIEVQKRRKCLVVLDDVWDTDVWHNILKPVFMNRQVNIKVLITTRKKEIGRDIDIDVKCYLYEQRHLNEKESWELLRKKVCNGLNIAGLSLDENRSSGRSVGENEGSSSNEDDDDDASSTAGSFHSCLTDEEEEEVIGPPDTPRSEDFIEDQRNQKDIERLGKEMVAQCGGLPLAIVVLGGLLMTKTTVSEWRTVHQNLSWYLRGKGSRENATVYEVLALSYHDLPYQLKPCFLHLGNFPEDFKIPTRKLYQLWSAENFISQECYQGEESTMDVAERCLRELAQRCMVQVQVDEASGRFKSCRLHDLTRELCLVKGKEENFLKKAPPRYEPEIIVWPASSMATLVSAARRLSVTVDCDFDDYFPPRKEKLEHIRSALFFSRLSYRRKFQTDLEFICKEFKLLRVLDLERFDFGDKVTKDIGNLIYLKYLSFRGSQFCKLPSSISNLRYLQTLDLRVPFLVCLVIPDVICKLIQLKNLYLPPNHMCTSKLQLGTLNQLETLKNFDTRVSDYRDIHKLIKLQKLAAILSLETGNFESFITRVKMNNRHIKDSSFLIRYDFQSRNELTLLRELVGFVHLRKLDLVGFIDRLPGHDVFSDSLTKLTLRASRLKEDPLATLEKLPNLYSLKLRNKVFEGNEICCSRQGFPQLRNLELQGLNSLECWTVEETAMPKLCSLKIDECVNLRMLPEGIKCISTLKELVIANMPDAFKNRIQKSGDEGGEDSYKVKHIPVITIIETNNASSIKSLGKQVSGNSYSGLLHSFSPALVPKVWQNS